MTATQTQDVEIKLSESALRSHGEALALIQRAYVWAQGADLSHEEIMDGRAEEIVLERQEKVRAMERSYFTNFAHVVTMSQGWDGPIGVWRDSEACLFWRHEKSGYCGGLIFHRDLALSNPGEPLTIGTWSIHT